MRNLLRRQRPSLISDQQLYKNFYCFNLVKSFSKLNRRPTHRSDRSSACRGRSDDERETLKTPLNAVCRSAYRRSQLNQAELAACVANISTSIHRQPPRRASYKAGVYSSSREQSDPMYNADLPTPPFDDADLLILMLMFLFWMQILLL